MVINNGLTLKQVLMGIEPEQYVEFKIESGEQFQTALWRILDLLNQTYQQQLPMLFDHYNWINHNQQDEVAYFLNEATSNAFNHSELKIPASLQLWIGKAGFVLGVSQSGQPFNAGAIKPGGGFRFFNSCRGTIFFDDFSKAIVIYLEYKL